MRLGLTMPKRPLRLLSVLISLLAIQNCSASGKSGAGIEAACAIFPAPSYSLRDTPETVAWFEGTASAPGYAVKWDRVCG